MKKKLIYFFLSCVINIKASDQFEVFIDYNWKKISSKKYLQKKEYFNCLYLVDGPDKLSSISPHEIDKFAQYDIKEKIKSYAQLIRKKGETNYQGWDFLKDLHFNNIDKINLLNKKINGK